MDEEIKLVINEAVFGSRIKESPVVSASLISPITEQDSGSLHWRHQS